MAASTVQPAVIPAFAFEFDGGVRSDSHPEVHDQGCQSRIGFSNTLFQLTVRLIPEAHAAACPKSQIVPNTAMPPKGGISGGAIGKAGASVRGEGLERLRCLALGQKKNTK
ncbi:MAG: hypothetical protein EBX52_03010 [Proteobacteria bacterium]|nr:hypothetical protein [Pseudomonadota bacterium]